MTRIVYGTHADGWFGYPDFIARQLEERQAARICEIGGGANPLFPLDRLAGKGIQYSVMDISRTELDKAPEGYDKIVADAGSREFRTDRRFDLVFSRMLLEHIRDAEQFHRNVHGMLAPGGMAVHFFPTLYTLPYLANYLMPERLSMFLLDLLAPRDDRHGKFPAYYRWCRGPIPSQIRRFRGIGYEVVEYYGFFGHEGYYQKIGIMRKIHNLKTRFLVRHPLPLFTSYAYVVLKKA